LGKNHKNELLSSLKDLQKKCVEERGVFEREKGAKRASNEGPGVLV